MLSSITYTPISEANLAEIRAIYNYYVENSRTIAYTVALTPGQVRNLVPIGHPKYRSFMIHETANPQTIATVGFVFYRPFNNRQAYEATAKVTIYLNPSFLRKGIGIQALQFIEKDARAHGIKHLIANVSEGNIASQQLFKKNNYYQVAQFRKVGIKFDQEFDLLSFQKDI